MQDLIRQQQQQLPPSSTPREKTQGKHETLMVMVVVVVVVAAAAAAAGGSVRALIRFGYSEYTLITEFDLVIQRTVAISEITIAIATAVAMWMRQLLLDEPVI
ncbi:hypothetical protein LSTR_LSTR010898 [Laodelphax striatellus]|uniref:Uncharacterized protein n=1 Tax=Laodelphax striatellus TaxID=195883 RepID=A0A482XJZ9_LAOST|nr:hypothetical protein LSTR_LSTR010898 [Laodelphax striatellus]